MKIVFIGTVEFSKKALQKLIDMSAHVVGVCTKEKSLYNSDFSDLAPLCKKNRIPLRFIHDINSKENVDWIKSFSPDIIFCFGWSSLIKKELLTLTPMGIIGYHPAKLPLNRGRHPIIWSLALGLQHSSSTFFFMDEGIDSGDILSQQDFVILNADDAQVIYNKIIKISLMQIEEFIPQLYNKSFKRIKQNSKDSNIWRKRGYPDGKIDFRMSSQAIYNLVRALTKPYFGAHTQYKKKDIILWKVKIVENKQKNLESGKILDSNKKSILVKTYDGAIEIIEHEFNELPMIGEYL